MKFTKPRHLPSFQKHAESQWLVLGPGEVVTREELRKRVWPSDTFVDFDHGINNAIKRLREALGDTAETPRFIETLPAARLPLHGCVGKWSCLWKISPATRSRSTSLTASLEALITSFAKISALRVVSRTTATVSETLGRKAPEESCIVPLMSADVPTPCANSPTVQQDASSHCPSPAITK